MNTISSQIWDVVVIGGGASGMMAAIQSARKGRSVLVLEKNASLGKKLLITGGGRCNVTNNKLEVRTILSKYKTAGKFLFSTFTQHSVADTIKFFAERGVDFVEENEGRLFPVSNTAVSIWEVLVQALKEDKVVVRMSLKVERVVKDNNTGVFTITDSRGKTIQAMAVVISTGGTSHPETGSTGDALSWLEALGHTIMPNSNALVPIALKDDWTKRLSGVALQDVKLTIYTDLKKHSSQIGKMIFTHVGISGPLVLNQSKTIGDLLRYNPVTLKIDLLPQREVSLLQTEFLAAVMSTPNKQIKNILAGFIPTALCLPLLQIQGIDAKTPAHSLRVTERKQLVQLLKAIPLSVLHLLGADKAVVSAGGVALEEVDFRTMQSRLVSGLYLTGDILDIDRPSGGYSLQLCWSTGFVAGTHA